MSCRVKGIVWKEGRACQLDRDQIKQQGIYYSPVDDARIEAQTSHDPDHCENGKDGIAELLIVGTPAPFARPYQPDGYQY